jgi:hypothetical protein
VDAQLITAVALYGGKTGALQVLLADVQGLCGERLGGAFRPYTLEQIHGTVIRLDGALDPRTGRIINQRCQEVTGQPRPMDLSRALALLTAHLTPPLRIRIGGFGPGSAARFRSRGQHPHERMFSAQGGALVLVGWPVATIASGLADKPLDDLRRAMASAGVMHWYHSTPGDIDNDFHLVVGHHDAGDGAAAQTVRAVRDHLARHPAEVEVGAAQVAVIASGSPTLAPARFIGRLPADPAQIAGLYR